MASNDKSLSHNEKSKTYAEKRRDEKKQSLREFIEAQQYLHAINNDLSRTISPEELNVVRFKTDTRMRLLGKILPDLKAIEHSGDANAPLVHRIERHVIEVNDTKN